MANRLVQALARRAGSRIANLVVPDAKGGEMRTLQNYRTEIYSYFTVVGEQQIMYSAENWVRMKLTLETAGPVSIGTSSQIAPVFSGKGRLLDTGVEYEVYLSRGARLYVVSESVNRLSVTIEPIPWMEQLSAEIVSVASVVSSTVQRVGDAIVNAIGQASGKTVTPAPERMEDLPTVRLPKAMASRLTPVIAPRKTR